MKSSEQNNSNKNVCQSTSGSTEFALSSKRAWVSHLTGKAWVVTIASNLLKSIISVVKYRLDLKELNKTKFDFLKSWDFRAAIKEGFLSATALCTNLVRQGLN